MKKDFDFTVVDAILAKYPPKELSTIAVLQDIQEHYHYLPEEIFTYVARALNVGEARLYGVATFYENFSLDPKGKYVIGCCLGTACYVKGAQQVIDKFSELLKIKPGETSEDGLFTLDALRCIGACGIAPAVSINGKVYPKLTVDAVPKVIEEYRSGEVK